MAFPNNKIWGPQLWYILHTFAEVIGRERPIKEKLLEAEEAIQFELFVKNIHKVLPCKVCKENAKEYLRQHHFSWSKLRRQELRDSCRLWLLDFHNAVTSHSVWKTDVAALQAHSGSQPAATATATFGEQQLREKYAVKPETTANLFEAIRIVSAEQKLGIPYRLVLEDDLIIFRQRYNNLKFTLFG